MPGWDRSFGAASPLAEGPDDWEKATATVGGGRK